MYNVLIIDDEEPLREAIRILGNWQELEVDEIREATDGKMGLAMLEQYKPNIVMVDMKMPELDGVEFLRIVEEKYPELLTIVISGYDDFEYTRQAIRAKVVDYLLKPVNRQDLNQALRKAVDVLNAKRERQKESITRNIAFNMSLPKLKEKIYFSIIERSFKKQSSQAFLSLIGADEPDHRYGALVLRILNMEAVQESRFHRDRELLHFAVANVINEVVVNNLQCFSFANPKQEREVIAIYTVKGGYPQEIAFRAGELMRKIVSTIGDLFGMLTVGGIGRYCEDVLHLAESYDEAVAGIQSIDLLKLKGNAVIGEVDKAASKETFSFSSRMPILRGALEAGNLNHAKSVVAEFAKSIKAAGSFSIGAADRLMREIVVLMNDTVSELGVPADKLPSSGGDRSLHKIGISTDITSFDQFEAILLHLTEYYHEQVCRSMAAGRPFSVEVIKEYIDHHYFEDIKISMFTERFFLSREYLMKLFKQQYGCGIHEYVQRVRMDKAKELLDDSSLKIQEISEMLGFKDKNYFSKAFRNYYALSPSEYRQQQEEQRGKK